jgi:predicted RNA polymerase sigma factor
MAIESVSQNIQVPPAASTVCSRRGRYHLLPAVAGDLLCRTREHGRARTYFLQAASLTSNTR